MTYLENDSPGKPKLQKGRLSSGQWTVHFEMRSVLADVFSQVRRIIQHTEKKPLGLEFLNGCETGNIILASEDT
jgi:hypothetical protein